MYLLTSVTEETRNTIHTFKRKGVSTQIGIIYFNNDVYGRQ